MKSSLAAGVRGEYRQRVLTEHLVSYRKKGGPPVLATPWLLYIMETAAYNAILPHLEAGEASVGVGFQFEHLAATPAGDTVIATAVITEVGERRVHLDFEARDSRDVIARGKHVRAIIQKERFMKRVKEKAEK